MTVSQMSATRMTDSPQHRQDWLGEQVLNWSGLPVVHLRPTVFLENPLFLDFAAESIAEDSSIRLPFGLHAPHPCRRGMWQRSQPHPGDPAHTSAACTS